jgi:hypothetical protein
MARAPIPVRYPSGVTPAFPDEILAQLGAFINPNLIVHYDDFLWVGPTATKYVITAASGSVVSSAAVEGGRALFTTQSADNAFAGITLPTAPFKLTYGKRAWFATRLRYGESAAGKAELYFGLEQTTTTFATRNDGLNFHKAEDSQILTLGMFNNSATAAASVQVGTGFAPGADYDIGFYLNEKGLVRTYFRAVADGGLFGYKSNASVGRLQSNSMQLLSTNFNTTSVNPTVAVYTRDATPGAATLSLDLLLAAVER